MPRRLATLFDGGATPCPNRLPSRRSFEKEFTWLHHGPRWRHGFPNEPPQRIATLSDEGAPAGDRTGLCCDARRRNRRLGAARSLQRVATPSD